MQYQVLIVKTGEGFKVSCPALVGCRSQGATREEALAKIREAIQDWSGDEEDDTKFDAEAEGSNAICELVNV
ncbi:MAG TPA: type II toxin-antitoxin system HicB family antitoxin [Verrucomicrobiae bacterium]|jgi:predicted RNase H-like HicB family nuclease